MTYRAIMPNTLSPRACLCRKMAMLFALVTLTAMNGWSAPAATAPDVYHFSPDFPKYVTAHVEVRDPTDVRWPSIFYGKPQTNGLISVVAARPAATFALNCDKRPQTNGDQSRRVLGELFDTPAKGGVVLHITELAGIKTDAKGLMEATVTGRLDVTGKKVPVNTTAKLRRHPAGKGDEKNESLTGELQFDTKAGELGLKTMPRDAPIQVRAAFTAYAETTATRRR